MPLFIVQRHRARTLHYDFRLEHNGVLKSWAVPKGVPEEPGVKRLSVQVEDHSIEFGDFEGTIPKGDYGAGEVIIWDRGSYDLQEWLDDRIVVTLKGSRVQGVYVLLRFPRQGDKAWLLFQSARQAPP
jgi:bifunctional non-homologous end joining protein LigD